MDALFLFDIDGTLLDTEGAGLRSLEAGWWRVFPDLVARGFPPLDLGGATDGSVVSFLFAHFGMEETNADRARFYAAYHEELDGTLSRNRKEGLGRVLDGVLELLEALDAEWPAHVRGLLTGNSAEGAATKLRHFGLEGHFAFGAFGDDHPDRNELGGIALRRVREVAGRGFRADQCVVIGDTPKDVACARACGARVVAVATGSSGIDELRATCPDVLLPDLTDRERALRALGDALR